VAEAMRGRHPGIAIEVEVIQTEGDRVLDRPLSAIGDPGVFIKEIESALLEKRVDLAVHSMKDLPSRLAPGLAIAAATERADPRDALVSRGPSSLEALPRGGTVATGSLRRRSQLLALRPDLNVEDLRGNVPTRIEKFDRSSWDAILNASTGKNNSTENKFPQFVLPRRFVSGFSLGLMVKDLRTALDVAHATGTPAPLGEACVEAWARAEQLLGGQADHTAVVQYWEHLAGAEIPRREG
jgi:hydroxymethylbilane synthase